MNLYEINEETLALLPFEENKTKIIETDGEIIINKNPMKIIDNSCKYFGSSYEGRFSGTKSLINISHKAPIIIEESRELIFFPTNSPRLFDCIWISLNNIREYRKIDFNKTEIIFTNGSILTLDISYGSLDNQILRSTRLNAVLSNRKKMEKLKNNVKK
ncbi:MAG: competence protein ComK [Bacilli bacterium]